MKILITGGNGFIGTSIVKKLNKDHDLTVIDVNQPKNIFPNVNYFKDDITQINEISKIVNSDYDGVIHLAAISRVAEGKKDPFNCIMVNIIGAAAILELAKKKKCWIIMASTEEKNENIYGITKNTSDVLAKQYSIDYDLKILSIKFSNVYGSIHDNSKKLIPLFINSALENENLFLDNSQLRFDYIHIDDLVEGINKAIGHIAYQEGQYYNQCTLCSNQDVSIKEIAEIIINTTGSESKIIEKKSSHMDTYIQPSSSQSKKLFGFETTINFNYGVKKLILSYSK